MKKILLLLLITAFYNLYSADDWEKLNAFDGGFITTLLFLPDSVILAASGTKIYKSNDYAETWYEVFDGMDLEINSVFDIPYISGIKIDPEGDIIASTTSEFSPIIISSDFGNSWHESKGRNFSDGIFKFEVTKDGVWLASNDYRCSFMYSTNKGESWEYKYNYIVDNTLDIKSNDSGYIFWLGFNSYGATLKIFNSIERFRTIQLNYDFSSGAVIGVGPNGYCAIGDHNKIFFSPDNGETFFEITNIPTNYLSGIYFDNFGGMYLTTDYHIYKYASYKTGWESYSGNYRSFRQPQLFLSNSGDIFMTQYGGGLFKYGLNWQKKDHGLGVRGPFRLTQNPENNEFFAIVNWVGAYFSRDGCNSWKLDNQPLINKNYNKKDTIEFFNLQTVNSISYYDGHKLIMTDESRIYDFSNKKFGYWKDLFGIINQNSTMVNVGKRIFVLTPQKGIFELIKTNDSFQLSPLNLNGLVDPTSITINDSGDMFVGTKKSGMYYLSSDGKVKKSINNGLFKNDSVYEYIFDLDVLKDGTIILAGSSGVYTSINNGDIWMKLIDGLSFFDILITREDDIYLLSYKDDFFMPKFSIFQTSDNGFTWKNISIDREFIRYYQLMQSNDDNIYVATNDGLYRLKTSLSNIIVNETEHDLLISISANHSLSVRILDSGVDDLYESSIAIYDLLGKKVMDWGLGSRVNSVPLRVNHKVLEFNIDVSGLPPGLYFVRLGNITRKFIKI